MRVHIALASTCPTILESSEDGGGGGGGGTSTSESEEGRKALKPDGPDWKLSNRQPEPPVVETPSEKPCEEMPCTADLEKTFAVSVLVERAMHLSLKGKHHSSTFGLHKDEEESKSHKWYTPFFFG